MDVDEIYGMIKWGNTINSSDYEDFYDLFVHYTNIVYVHHEMKYLDKIDNKYAKFLKVTNTEELELEDVFKYQFIYMTVKKFLLALVKEQYLLKKNLHYDLDLYFNDNHFEPYSGIGPRFTLLGIRRPLAHNFRYLEHFQETAVELYEKNYYPTDELYYNTFGCPVQSYDDALHLPDKMRIILNELARLA